MGAYREMPTLLSPRASLPAPWLCMQVFVCKQAQHGEQVFVCK